MNRLAFVGGKNEMKQQHSPKLWLSVRLVFIILCLVMSQIAVAQDVVQPQLCAGDSPTLTSLQGVIDEQKSEFQYDDEFDVFFVEVPFANEIEQQFTITVAGTSDSELRQYLTEINFCFEALPLDYVPTVDDGVVPEDIANRGLSFAEMGSIQGEEVEDSGVDVFAEAVAQVLGFQSSADLFVDAEAVHINETQSLQEYLTMRGDDTDQVINDVLVALDSSNEGRTLREDFIAQGDEVEILRLIFEQYDLAAAADPRPEIVFSIALDAAPELGIESSGEEGEEIITRGYAIIFVIDPTITAGKEHCYQLGKYTRGCDLYPRAISIISTVRTSQGSVSARLLNGSSTIVAGPTTAAGSSGIELASVNGNSLRIFGRHSVSRYTLSGIWVVN